MMDKELLFYQMAVLTVALGEALELAGNVVKNIDSSSVQNQKAASDAMGIVSSIQGTIVFLEVFKGRMFDE